MSKIEKLIERFKQKPKDFTWYELVKLLSHFGYQEIHGQGSVRKFYYVGRRLITLHEPHPGRILKFYQIEYVLILLTEEGLI